MCAFKQYSCSSCVFDVVVVLVYPLLLLLLFLFSLSYSVKLCCKIYRNLLAILVARLATKTVNLQKFCKLIITIALLHAVKML